MVCTAKACDKLRILLIEPAEVVRAGVAAILAQAARLLVCATTGDYDDAFELIRQENPSLVVIEPFNGARDGITHLKELRARYPDLKLLVASHHCEATYALRALRAGAVGYWMKTGSAESLLHAVETVAAGEVFVSARVALLAVHELVDRRNVPASRHLTDREMHVFALIGAGHGVGRIAKELGISRKTVETHCDHIKNKLGYSIAAELKRGAQAAFSK